MQTHKSLLHKLLFLHSIKYIFYCQRQDVDVRLVKLSHCKMCLLLQSNSLPFLVTFSRSEWNTECYFRQRKKINKNMGLQSVSICSLLSTLINVPAAFVIHSSHLSDNTLIPAANTHTPPGYLQSGLGSTLRSQQERGIQDASDW